MLATHTGELKYYRILIDMQACVTSKKSATYGKFSSKTSHNICSKLAQTSIDVFVGSKVPQIEYNPFVPTMALSSTEPVNVFATNSGLKFLNVEGRLCRATLEIQHGASDLRTSSCPEMNTLSDQITF